MIALPGHIFEEFRRRRHVQGLGGRHQHYREPAHAATSTVTFVEPAGNSNCVSFTT